MTKRKKIVLTAIAYFLNILIFATVYWMCWGYNPSNFIVNEQYNEQTVRPFFVNADLPDTNLFTEKLMTPRDANELIKPLNDTIKNLTRRQQDVDRLLLQNKILDSLNNEKLMKSFDKNFEQYLDNQLKFYNKIRDSLTVSISNYENLKQTSDTNSIRYFQFDVEVAKLNVLLAKNDVVINNIKYNAYDKSLKSMPSFYDDTLFQIASLLYDRIGTLEKKKGQLLEHIRNEKEKIRIIAADYYISRVYKLSFSDFIYFSIITASSTGYGDIMPNNSIIRIFVSVEILLSLFLLGFFFYFISMRGTE